MHSNESKVIRHAIDDCLAGLQNRPSLKARVWERVEGKRRAPRRLTLAMAAALLLTLLAAAALAIGAFSGRFSIGQETAGAFRSCLSTGDRLYVMTSEGLHVWQPEDEEMTLLLSSEVLREKGLSFDTLLFRYEGDIGLLCRECRQIWKYQNGELTLLADYAGSEWDRENQQIASAVYQDGWLFVRLLEADDTVYDAKAERMQLSSGTVEKLDLEGVLEICSGPSGELYAVIGSMEQNQDSLVVIDTESGKWKSTLYTASLQSLEGLACDPDTHQLYALVKGVLSRWSGTTWEEMQGYAPHHLADSFAIVRGGFVSISYAGMQYLPFEETGSVSTFKIRGYIALGDADADFQEAYPSVAVARERDPSLTAAAIRTAIESGDTTDLFHVKLDSDLIEMFQSGLLAPLSTSDLLVQDAEEMLPVFHEALFAENQLFAVPSMVIATVWTAEEAVPHAFEELLRQHAAQKLSIAYHWAQEPWTKSEYADYLLTTYIAETTKQCGKVDFDTLSFRSALTALASAALPAAAQDPANASISTHITVSLSGTRTEQRWEPPCTIRENALPSVPVQLIVYVLNPNAENPDIALQYLAYIATHRQPNEEAMLKPDNAQPALHAGVLKQMEWIVEDRRAYAAEHGLEADEAELQAALDALASDPTSWNVEEGLLNAYKARIVPYLDLRISPLLSSGARASGVYDALLNEIMDYLEGKLSLEECLDVLNQLAETRAAEKHF